MDVQFSIVRAIIVSAPAKGIGFRHGQYLTTLRVMGFGRSTEFGYTTVRHHQALRMIMVNSPVRAVAVHISYDPTTAFINDWYPRESGVYPEDAVFFLRL